MFRTEAEARVDITRPLCLYHPRVGNSEGHSCNIGERGLVFTAPDCFEPGDLVDMEIALTPHRRVRCVAYIVWRESACRSGKATCYGADFVRFEIGDGWILRSVLSEIRAGELVAA